jgi:hypothetical protein
MIELPGSSIEGATLHATPQRKSRERKLKSLCYGQLAASDRSCTRDKDCRDPEPSALGVGQAVRSCRDAKRAAGGAEESVRAGGRETRRSVKNGAPGE